MSLATSKQVFLSNDKNKQKFINSLAQHLQRKGCKTIHADLPILVEALKQAEKVKTTIIGKDRFIGARTMLLRRINTEKCVFQR